MTFLNNIVEKLIELVTYFGYPGITFIVGLEYACFPLPSEVILPFIGITASKTHFTYGGAILFSILGGLIGSIICYFIGYYGGGRLLSALETKFPKTKKSIAALNKWFSKYGKITVLLARLLPLTRTYVSLLAGATKFNIVTFCLYSTIGIALWNTVLISLGFFIGENWSLIGFIMNQYSIVVLIIAFIVIATILIKKLSKKAFKKIAIGYIKKLFRKSFEKNV